LDEKYVGGIGGWKVEELEREYRPTKADKGGVRGWVELMGKQFFDALEEDVREEAVGEVCELVKGSCASPGGGGDYFGNVRLRAIVRKI